MNAIGRDIAALEHVRHALLLAIGGGGNHCIQSIVGVESGEAFQIGIGNDRHRAVAGHTLGFAAVQCPDGQFVVLLVNREHGVHQVRHNFGVDDCEQWAQGSIGVPQRERGVVGEALGSVNHVVDAAILPVDVAECRRSNHGVIERGVEHALGSGVVGGHFNSAEAVLPLAAASSGGAIEVEARHLGSHVGMSIFAAHRRESHLHHHLFFAAEVKHALHSLVAQLRHALDEFVLSIKLDVTNFFVSLEHEVGFAHRAPAASVAITLDGVVVDTTNHRADGYAAHAIFEVHQHIRWFVGRIGVAMQAHACGGGEFSLDAIALEHHRIIVGASDLGFVAILRCIAF